MYFKHAEKIHQYRNSSTSEITTKFSTTTNIDMYFMIKRIKKNMKIQ